MDFANRFKILRKEKGYTQQQIADLCFLDKSTVCRWEKGDNYPNQQTQSKLADLLGVSIDYLMGRTDMRMISFPSDGVIEYPVIGSVRAGMGGNVVSEDWVDLVPNNPTFPPARISGADLENCKTRLPIFKSPLFTGLLRLFRAKYLCQFVPICAVLQNFVPIFVP